MRIVLALLMCCGVAFAQDTTKYFKSVDYGWNWQRGKFRGGLILPTDTTNNKLGIAQIDANCYAWSGTKWSKINSSDTTFLIRYYRKNQVDSAILANSPALTLQDVTTNGKTTTDSIIAAAFKRIGGTSSQFLKANGSVDNSTYLTSSALSGYVPYSSYGSNNVSANNYFDGFTSIDATTTPIVLTVNSTPSYLITGRDGQTIKLPNATTLPLGTLFTFNNNQSSGAILVNNNSNTLVKSIPSGGNVIIELIDNQNAAGIWDAHSQAPSNVSWSTNTFDYAGSITSATWNGVNVALNRGGTGANTASGARTNLGSTTVGDNFFTLTNPSAITFPRINADNTVSTLDASTFRTAIGAGTSSTNGTVTSIVAGTGLSGGTITTGGTISADTSILATKLLLQKKIDSVNANVSAKGSGTITSITLGRGITGSSPITSTGTIGLDTTKSYTWTGQNTFNTSAISSSLFAAISAASTREQIIKANVSDATNDAWFVYNGTLADASFIPTFGGICNTSSARSSLQFVGFTTSTNDAGSTPLVQVQGFKTTSATDPANGTLTSITTRPIFSVSNTGSPSNLLVNANGTISMSSLATGIVYSNAGVLTSTNPSDSTLKNSIEDIPYGLNDILKLKPKTYYYNSDSTKTYLKYGFIAQDVQNIMPKIVRKLEPENPESKLGLESEAIYVAMVKAIQELEDRVKELEKKLNAK